MGKISIPLSMEEWFRIIEALRKPNTHYTAAIADELNLLNGALADKLDRDINGMSEAALNEGWDDDDNSEPRCTSGIGHHWVVSDEDENHCYCCNCGIREY